MKSEDIISRASEEQIKEIPRDSKQNSRKIYGLVQAGSKQQSRGTFHRNSNENPSKTEDKIMAYSKQVPSSSPEENSIEIPRRTQAQLGKESAAYSKQVPSSSPEETSIEILRRIQAQLKNTLRLIPSRFQAAVQGKIPWKFSGESKQKSRQFPGLFQAGSKHQSRGKFH